MRSGLVGMLGAGLLAQLLMAVWPSGNAMASQMAANSPLEARQFSQETKVPGAWSGSLAPADTSLDIVYSGRVLGIPVLRSSISAAFVGKSYAARADFRSTGLAALFKQVKVVASTKGVVEAGHLRTNDYWHKELDGRKNRELSMNYYADEVTLRVNPPLHTMGDPAASMAQRLEAVDPLSGILSLAMQAGSEARSLQCAGTVKVFDGKQRYDLQLQAMGLEKVRTKAYKGQALRCNVWYHPIAGFDEDDLADPKEYEKPIVMWLADLKQGNMRVPVRFEARFGFGRAVVEARKIDIRQDIRQDTRQD